MPAEWFTETRVKVQSIKHADTQISGACKIPQIPFGFMANGHLLNNH
jgi:hypothetical protein